MKLAAIQMISGPDVTANLAAAARLIAHAAEAGAQIVALPEYFPLIGASDAARLAAREDIGAGPIQEFLATTARHHGLWLIGGTLPLAASAPAKLRNSCLVYGPQGQCLARYDKIHLFAFDNGTEHYAESEVIEAGENIVTASIAGLRVGLAVCYDLRFPELFRRMADPDPLDLIVLPAAFTATTGRAHWELLLRARAVENQCYVLAAAQGGEHPGGRRTHGHSMIIDPWGEVLACHATGEAVVLAEFSAARLTEIRQRLPALQHRVF